LKKNDIVVQCRLEECVPFAESQVSLGQGKIARMRLFLAVGLCLGFGGNCLVHF